MSSKIMKQCDQPEGEETDGNDGANGRDGDGDGDGDGESDGDGTQNLSRDGRLVLVEDAASAISNAAYGVPCRCSPSDED